MPAIDPRQQKHANTGGGFQYTETRDQQLGWANVREYIENHEKHGHARVLKNDTFFLKGVIREILLDNGGYFYEKQPRTRQGETVEIDWPHVKVVGRITDPRVVVNGAPLELIPKKVGASFYDGRTRDGGTGTARGGLFHVHLACYHDMPPDSLVEETIPWETGWYEWHPVLLEIKYGGEAEQKYANQRNGLTLWLQGFSRDPDVKRPPSFPTIGVRPGDQPAGSGQMRIVDSPVDLAASPTIQRAAQAVVENVSAAAPSGAGSTATASGGDPLQQRATERQVKFIFAIARECGLDEEQVENTSLELYAQEVNTLNRRDASTLIEYFQRRRNEVA